jgi:uncharacterized membrane protein YccC
MRALVNGFKQPTRTVWRHAIRMSSAALFAYLVTDLVGLHRGYWAVITCLVVIQGSLGATISAGIARVAGTAAGAAAGGAGAILALLVPAIPQWVILLLVIAPLALLSASRAIFRLAPLTGALVLLLAGAGSLGFAFSRVAEIGLGTVIGVLFSLFVLPERATASLVARAASILELLGPFAVVLLTDNASPEHERIALRLRSAFAQLQTDMKEVEQERVAHLLRSDPFAERLMRHLQRLRTDVNMLGRAVLTDDKDAHLELAERIRALFLGYAAALREKAALPAAEQFDDLRCTEAPETPAGFAVLTLQGEFKALHETLRQWADPESLD